MLIKLFDFFIEIFLNVGVKEEFMVDFSGRKVLGSLIYSKKKTICEMYGKEDFKDLVSAIDDEEVREILNGSVMSNEWYPMKVLMEFILAIERKYGRDFLQRLLEIQTEQQIKGVYALFAKFLTISMVAPRADSMWKKQYGVGDLKVEYDDKQIKGILTNYETIDLHAFALWVWLKKFIECVLNKKIKDSNYKFVDSSTLEFFYLLE